MAEQCTIISLKVAVHIDPQDREKQTRSHQLNIYRNSNKNIEESEGFDTGVSISHTIKLCILQGGISYCNLVVSIQ